jgi:hypothetical protein
LLSGEVTSVDAVSDVLSLDFNTSLGTSTGAQGQGEAGVLVTDHGSDIIWGIVGSGADSLAGRAVNHNTRRVGRVALLGWDNLHATS